MHLYYQIRQQAEITSHMFRFLHDAGYQVFAIPNGFPNNFWDLTCSIIASLRPQYCTSFYCFPRWAGVIVHQIKKLLSRIAYFGFDKIFLLPHKLVVNFFGCSLKVNNSTLWRSIGIPTIVFNFQGAGFWWRLQDRIIWFKLIFLSASITFTTNHKTGMESVLIPVQTQLSLTYKYHDP